jgi:glutathione synthase/RimK-type ligase-like ATP-grasp enzyme
LRQLDDLLAREPDAIEVEVERAALLNALGRPLDARQAYLEVLKRAPTHFGALNDFGGLLSATGHRSAARTVYSEAVTHHPDNPMAHVNLANLLRRSGDTASARAHYETALRLDADHPQAHQGLGNLLAELGDLEGAEFHRRKGFQAQFITTLPYRGTKPPIPLLLLVSASGGNIPTASFLDNRVFLSSVCVAEFYDPRVPLPPHDLIFNTIGDADLCRAGLEAAFRVLAQTAAPVLNHPSAILETGRLANARRLSDLPGVITPRMIELPRSVLVAPDAACAVSEQGFTFPLLLRAPGFHTGHHFFLVENAGELSAAAAQLPGDNVLIIEYLNARGPDGKARKYRVMFIDGEIYPLHLAVSRHWKVHYFTADMADHPEHRREDAAFLNDMSTALGPAVSALARIRDALNIDYGGIDFGLNEAGQVLVFEANATMVVNPPDADDRWSYRRPAVKRILDAVHTMMVGRAATD